MDDWGTTAQQIMARLEQLAQMSETPLNLTRPAFSPALRQVHTLMTAWMQAAGMTVCEDAIGNLSGRYPAASEAARTLILGSHLDTVRDAGIFDGTLGVLLALACVERLHAQQRRLPFHVDIIAFADEEGLRFQASCLGSRALAGSFDPALLELTDAQGMTLAAALRAFGGDPERLAEVPRHRAELLGYCEVHIEQGPQLEAQGVPVGVVTAIAGQSRIRVCFCGRAGHAGTVPMDLRADAFCGAAAFVLATEAYARERPALVATVGAADVQPGASNVIPGAVLLTLDVRHPDDSQRQQACQSLADQARQIAHARGLTVDWRVMDESPAALAAPHLSAFLEQAIAQVPLPVVRLASGAGHDAAPLAALTHMAMLFVRCAGGISHHPDESVLITDIAIAGKVVEQFLELATANHEHL